MEKEIVDVLNGIREVLSEKLDEISTTLDEIRGAVSGENKEE